MCSCPCSLEQLPALRVHVVPIPGKTRQQETVSDLKECTVQRGRETHGWVRSDTVGIKFEVPWGHEKRNAPPRLGFGIQ